MIDEHKQYFIYGNLETEKKEVKRVCGGVANGYDEKKLVDYYDNTIVPFGRYCFENQELYLYKDSTIYLKRKYSKFLKYMERLAK